jgi:hypothetical protein
MPRNHTVASLNQEQGQPSNTLVTFSLKLQFGHHNFPDLQESHSCSIQSTSKENLPTFFTYITKPWYNVEMPPRAPPAEKPDAMEFLK